MAALRYATHRLCHLKVGCDGEVTLAKDGVCQNCKNRIERLRRAKKEYERIQVLVAQAERNGRSTVQGVR